MTVAFPVLLGPAQPGAGAPSFPPDAVAGSDGGDEPEGFPQFADTLAEQSAGDGDGGGPSFGDAPRPGMSLRKDGEPLTENVAGIAAGADRKPLAEPLQLPPPAGQHAGQPMSASPSTALRPSGEAAGTPVAGSAGSLNALQTQVEGAPLPSGRPPPASSGTGSSEGRTVGIAAGAAPQVEAATGPPVPPPPTRPAVQGITAVSGPKNAVQVATATASPATETAATPQSGIGVARSTQSLPPTRADGSEPLPTTAPRLETGVPPGQTARDTPTDPSTPALPRPVPAAERLPNGPPIGTPRPSGPGRPAEAPILSSTGRTAPTDSAPARGTSSLDSGIVISEAHSGRPPAMKVGGAFPTPAASTTPSEPIASSVSAPGLAPISSADRPSARPAADPGLARRSAASDLPAPLSTNGPSLQGPAVPPAATATPRAGPHVSTTQMPRPSQATSPPVAPAPRATGAEGSGLARAAASILIGTPGQRPQEMAAAPLAERLKPATAERQVPSEPGPAAPLVARPSASRDRAPDVAAPAPRTVPPPARTEVVAEGPVPGRAFVASAGEERAGMSPSLLPAHAIDIGASGTARQAPDQTVSLRTTSPAPAMAIDAGATAARQVAAVVASQPAPARIELHLDPPELGRVDIRLDIADQGLRAVVQSERGATADLLRRHGEILMAQLQDAGFSEIDLRFAGGDRQGGHRSASGEGPALFPADVAPEANDPGATAPPQPSASGADRLDLRL